MDIYKYIYKYIYKKFELTDQQESIIKSCPVHNNNIVFCGRRSGSSTVIRLLAIYNLLSFNKNVNVISRLHIDSRENYALTASLFKNNIQTSSKIIFNPYQLTISFKNNKISFFTGIPQYGAEVSIYDNPEKNKMLRLYSCVNRTYIFKESQSLLNNLPFFNKSLYSETISNGGLVPYSIQGLDLLEKTYDINNEIKYLDCIFSKKDMPYYQPLVVTKLFDKECEKDVYWYLNYQPSFYLQWFKNNYKNTNFAPLKNFFEYINTYHNMTYKRIY